MTWLVSNKRISNSLSLALPKTADSATFDAVCPFFQFQACAVKPPTCRAKASKKVRKAVKETAKAAVPAALLTKTVAKKSKFEGQAKQSL